MAIPSVGKKAFTARRFGAGLGFGLRSGVGFVDSIFIRNSMSYKSLNHYNAFTASVQKNCSRISIEDKKQPTGEVGCCE